MPVENCHKSHKPVETGDLPHLTIQGRGGSTWSPTRRGKTADGPLRGKEGLFSEA